jgi:hypothetical protein
VGEIFDSVVDSVQRIRAVRMYRASSAAVRWVILIAIIGVGAALLIAFAVSLLVSLVPSANG